MPGFIRGLALPDREILASAVLDRRNAILLARASFADGAPAEVRAALGRRLRQSGQSLPVTTETHGGTPMATVTDVGWELSCQYTAGRRATVLRGCVTVADTLRIEK